MNAGAPRARSASRRRWRRCEFIIDLFVKDKVTPPIKNLVTENSMSQLHGGQRRLHAERPVAGGERPQGQVRLGHHPVPRRAAGSTPRVSGSGFAIPSGVRRRCRSRARVEAAEDADQHRRAGHLRQGRPQQPGPCSARVSAFQPPPDNLGIVQQILAGKVAGGHAFDVTTNWNQVKQLLGQDLPRTFLGQVTVADAITGLTPRLDVLMRQHQDNMRQATASEGVNAWQLADRHRARAAGHRADRVPPRNRRRAGATVSR